jgi:hypothetical protein
VNHLTDLLMPAELTVFSLGDAGQAKNRDITRFAQVFSRARLRIEVLRMTAGRRRQASQPRVK